MSTMASCGPVPARQPATRAASAARSKASGAGSMRDQPQATRDVRAVTIGTFTWLIDATHESTLSDPDNRLIGVYGTSTSQAGPRKKSRIAGFPLPESLSSRRVHRGHAAGHSLGGPDEGYNLFVQTAAVNVGREWRSLERYCAAHPGTFFFVRAVYLDISDIPAALEFGVIRDGVVLDVHYFENRRA